MNRKLLNRFAKSFFSMYPPPHFPSPLAFNLLCVCAQLLQSCPTLCNFMGLSPPGSSVHGILQGRILEWVAMPSSKGPSLPRDGTRTLMSLALADGFFTTSISSY